MTESDLLSEILLAYSRGNTRLLRANAGLAWQGRVLEQTPTRLVLAYPRPLRLMAPGVSDLIGWHTCGGIAVFTALELKVGRRQPTHEQGAFLETVQRAGGIAAVVRSVDEAKLILDGYLKR